MKNESITEAWETLTHAEKRHRLFLQQKETLDQFLKTGAISQAQHDKSLGELKEKMNEQQPEPAETTGENVMDTDRDRRRRI